MKKYFMISCFWILGILLCSAQGKGTLVKEVTPVIFTQETPAVEALETFSQEAHAQETPSMPTTRATDQVGSTPGTLSVSLTGGAVYEIPIAVPEGVASIAPQVSLSYNSQAAYGIAGYGWNIAGFSSISRIAPTPYHDNIKTEINFTSTDRFALDGQRLLLASGSYGAADSQYETENFSNLRITAHGIHPAGTSYGPAYFIVQYPDGTKAWYGNEHYTQSQTQWVLSYWENPQGLSIRYFYVADGGGNLIMTAITYGSHHNETPLCQIDFIYKTKQRTEQGYIAGFSFTQNKLLSQIKVSAQGTGYRNYSLEHNTNSLGYDRLMSITESSGDGSKSYAPTTFQYDTTSNEGLFAMGTPVTINQSGIDLTNTNRFSGDFDGDGKTDFILYPKSKHEYTVYTKVVGRSESRILFLRQFTLPHKKAL